MHTGVSKDNMELSVCVCTTRHSDPFVFTEIVRANILDYRKHRSMHSALCVLRH